MYTHVSSFYDSRDLVILSLSIIFVIIIVWLLISVRLNVREIFRLRLIKTFVKKLLNIFLIKHFILQSD